MRSKLCIQLIQFSLQDSYRDEAIHLWSVLHDFYPSWSPQGTYEVFIRQYYCEFLITRDWFICSGVSRNLNYLKLMCVGILHKKKNLH